MFDSVESQDWGLVPVVGLETVETFDHESITPRLLGCRSHRVHRQFGRYNSSPDHL